MYFFMCLLFYITPLEVSFGLLVYKKCASDVTIAGLFPISEDGVKIDGGRLKCTGRVSSKGIQEALAMVYAVHLINKNNNILPNISLGVDIADSCSNNEIVIRNCLQFHFVRRNSYLQASSYHFTPDTVAVVGLRKSSISKTVSTFTNLFNVPAISYGSTDHELSNKDIYPSFARTIPSNTFLGKALVVLLRKLRWNLVHAVYDKTDYGLSAFQIFRDYLHELNENADQQSERICLADVFEFKDFIKDIHVIKNKWMLQRKATAVILFVHREKGTKLLQNVFSEQFRGYTWVFSEGIDYSAKIKRLFRTSRTHNNVLSVQPKQFPCKDYQRFVNAHYFSKEFRDLIPRFHQCIRANCLRVMPELSFFVPYVIDAVNVIAHALHKYYGCKPNERCKFRYQPKPLMDFVLNVSFPSQLGYQLEFTKDGDVFGQYEIGLLQEQFQSPGRIRLLHKVGLWDSRNQNDITLNIPISTYSISSCHIICPEGYGIAPRKEHSQCCSKCLPCAENEYTNTSTFKCETCSSKFLIPNKLKNGCTEMKLILISYNSKLGLGIVTASTVGIGFVVFITAIFFSYRSTHFVRSSSFDLSLIMLFGCAIGFASPHLAVGRITNFTCRISIVVSGLSLSLIVGTLFVKTNRIYRIFSKKIMEKGVRFLSRKWQLCIIGMFTSFSCILSFTVAYFPPEPIKYERIIHPTKLETYASCQFSTKMSAVWWAYKTILILLCTYQAILARKLPDSYNEAKSISFAMMSISLEMFFLVPGFYYSGQQTYIQLTYAVINVVSAISTICFMFLPKIYLIICRPEKNKEHLPHGNLGEFDSSTVIENISSTELHSPCKRRKLCSKSQHGTKPDNC